MSFPLDLMQDAIHLDVTTKLAEALAENEQLRADLALARSDSSKHRCHDETCFILGTAHPCHDPACAGAQLPDFLGLQRRVAEHEEIIQAMAKSAHQAWHREIPGGWWTCPRSVCMSAQQALPLIVRRLKGPGYL